MSSSEREAFRRGFRLGVPYAAAGFVLSLSFGVLARQAGFTATQAIVMSLIVFAGSAQFTAVSVMAAGGGLAAAIAGAAMINGRFLAMGIALAPSLPGGPLKRAAQGQPIVDASWALASQSDGSFDRWQLFGCTAPQYVTWALGTVTGALIGSGLDIESLGLDAIYPTFFLSLLFAEMKDGRTRGVAVFGAVVALALVPFTPPGVPILAAAVAALVGLRP